MRCFAGSVSYRSNSIIMCYIMHILWLPSGNMSYSRSCRSRIHLPCLADLDDAGVDDLSGVWKVLCFVCIFVLHGLRAFRGNWRAATRITTETTTSTLATTKLRWEASLPSLPSSGCSRLGLTTGGARFFVLSAFPSFFFVVAVFLLSPFFSLFCCCNCLVSDRSPLSPAVWHPRSLLVLPIIFRSI